MANNKPQSRSSRSPSAELSDDYDLKTNINPAHSYRALKSSIQKQYERHQGVQFAARHAIEMNEIKEAQKREDALIAAEKNRIRELKRLELKRAKHAKYIQQRAELEAKQEADIAAEQARIESEKARQAAQAAEVAAQQAQAAAERQRQEQAAAAAAAAARAAPPPPQPSTASTSGASLNNGGVPAANHDYHIGARHIMPANLQKSKIGLQQASAGDGSLPHSQELLTIHGRLKQIRVIVKKELNSDKEYKAFIGNARRKIVSAVGKLVPDARQNQPILAEMLGLIQSTLTITNKTNVNPLDYMTSPAPSPVANPDPAHPTITTPQVPSAFIYLLNIFSKSIIRQFKEEASVNPRAAQKIGKAASMLFAKPSITYHHRSMISILLAKFRKEIPILFGVRGSEATERGRTAINWARMGDGSWVDSGVHNNTMTGLAAGFSAIGLRSYALSQMNNPCPPVIWWNAFAAVTRHNGQPVENTHYTILKALVEHNEMVIKNFFGDRGLAAFVNAIYVFPSKAKNPNSPEVLSVVAYWEKLYRITGMSLQRIRTGPQPVLNEVYPDWAKPVAQPPGRPGW